MEKNTLENNIHDPDRWDMSRLDKELDFEILEEIPEVKSVEHSTIFQLFFFTHIGLGYYRSNSHYPELHFQ